MDDDKFRLESVNTRMKPIKLSPITTVTKSTNKVNNIVELNQKQLEVFANIEKIKRSGGYSSKSKPDVYKIKALQDFLQSFGKYPKNLKKDAIIEELVNQYEKHRGSIKTETKKSNIPVNTKVTIEDYTQL